jgi:hypothetical protein
MAELPPESNYRQTEFPGFWSVVRDLVRNARRVSHARSPKGTSAADEWYKRRARLLDERYGRRERMRNAQRHYRYDEPEMADESLPEDLAPSPQAQTAS